MRNLQLPVILKWALLITLVFIFITGLYMAIAPVKPFWLDEWSIIHNLKFKTQAELWGELDFMQQFPRVYLQVAKAISQAANYSYSSLRILSYLVHLSAIILCYRLSARVYGKEHNIYRLLWVTIYVSFPTSLEYFVQIKQYTMEMFLGLVGIWQLLELLRMEEHRPGTARYLLLCATMLIAPFFSYTYPIVITPVYFILFLRSISDPVPAVQGAKARQWFAVLLSLAGIGVFYLIDVSHVMQDKGMQNYWDDYMMQHGFDIRLFAVNMYKFWGNPGAGDLFQAIYAIAGIAGFVAANIYLFKMLAARKTYNPVVLYSTVLVWLIIILFSIGKLPVGSHRLNAFATPAIGILIVYIFTLPKAPRIAKGLQIFAGLLILAACGNIFSTLIGGLTNEKHMKAQAIYDRTTKAIQDAQKDKLIIYVASNVASPYDAEIKADWVVKTLPAYNIKEPIPVYPMDNKDSLMQVLKTPALMLTADSTWITVR